MWGASAELMKQWRELENDDDVTTEPPTVVAPTSNRIAQDVAPRTTVSLFGSPLPQPRMYPVDWRDGQRFTERDDPDRMREPWEPPPFVKCKDPALARARTTVDEIHLPADVQADSFARVVHNVLAEEECAALIEAVNQKGFTPALINIGGGAQQLIPEARDGHRVVVDSSELTDWIFEVIRPALPVRLRNCTLIELNERCRFLCYTPGQEFAPHCDGRYTRPFGHANAGDISRVTLQIYLHDLPVADGGATTFLFHRGHPAIPFQPRAGSVLLFTQDLLHEGSLLKNGLKYTLRTEAMYRRDAED